MPVGNQQPTQSAGRTLLLTNRKTLTVGATTGSEGIYRVTGSVLVMSIWGVVVTARTTCTAAHFRLNDQTAQPAITLAAGITLSALAAGTVFAKTALAAAALTLMSNAAGVIVEPATAGIPVPSPFVLVKKTGANTDIEFRYTSVEAANGVFKFYCEYRPLTDDGALVAL